MRSLINATTTVIVFYDYVLTFDIEVKRIWRRSFGLPDAIFLANRCLAIALSLPLVVGSQLGTRTVSCVICHLRTLCADSYIQGVRQDQVLVAVCCMAKIDVPCIGSLYKSYSGICLAS